jgi:hypothetical protein
MKTTTTTAKKTANAVKTEKVVCVTKFVLNKEFTYYRTPDLPPVTYKKGRVLETIRHRRYHYYPADHVITLGHGWAEVIPADHIKAKWYEETTKTIVKTKEVPVAAPTTK